MSYYQTMYGTDDVDTKLPVEKIAKINGFSRGNELIIELGDELIRCKDCKHYRYVLGYIDGLCGRAEWYKRYQREDDYCSRAERK